MNKPTAETMESPLRGDTHGGFGERPGETDQQQCRHRAPGRLIGATLLPGLDSMWHYAELPAAQGSAQHIR